MPLPLDWRSLFLIIMSCLAGLLGGGDAISAMTSVQVIRNRRWLGWRDPYCSFQIANWLNSSAKSPPFANLLCGERSLKSFYKRTQLDPTALLKVDGRGPRFWTARSVTIAQDTGYLAKLLVKECSMRGLEVVPERGAGSVGVTVIDLDCHAPVPETRLARGNAPILPFAAIPLVISIWAWARCVIRKDWYASLAILIGILAGALYCFVLGLGDVVFTYTDPARESSTGHGVLFSDKDIVLLRGSGDAVMSIAHGKFSLHFASEAHHAVTHWCSILFFVQFITSLFVVTLASSFGQAMFFVSLSASVLYNVWLSSLDIERVHRKILFDRVLEKPMLTKYTFGTRTAAAVFTLLALQSPDPTGLLDELFPDNAKVWTQWKVMIPEWLRHPNQPFRLGMDLDDFTQQDKHLSALLSEDVRAAYNGYTHYLQLH